MHIKKLLPGASRAPESRGETSPVLSLQCEINQLFDNFWRGFDRPFAGFLSESESVTEPCINVAETDSGVEITAELPGMDEKDIEVSVSDDTITIKGEKKSEREEKKKGYYLAERSYGSIYRSLQLPAGVDGSQATAEFKQGVLTVTAPESAEAASKVKKIDVKKG
ncbi:MAG: Hsp20/alpha crystallin family protein [Alphaproteobacteria bacterium]|nr:Hsp20/alpha crystallin family protein [Alphaproteobacteria bacterium]